MLRPFIAASWHGHRNDLKIPEPVREVWQKKFRGQGFGGKGQQSNVDLAILDAEGNLVHWFDAFRRMGPRPGPGGGQKRESLGEYTIRGLNHAIRALDLDHVPTAEHPLKLPGLQEPGIRVFVRLLEERMRAYRAPVVEVVALDEQDWEPLQYPRKKRRVEASDLKPWVSQVYPPGVMERTSQQTKKVYQISRVAGDLTIRPAGSDGKLRYALLSGKIRLTDEGPGDFTYGGELEVVLSYSGSSSKPLSVRGVFEGIYPRYNPVQRQSRDIPLRAAFESLSGGNEASGPPRQ